MNTLKTVVVVGVLGIVGYGLYQGLHNGFQFQNTPPPPPEFFSDPAGGPPAPPSIGIAPTTSPGIPADSGMESAPTNESIAGSQTRPAADIPSARYPDAATTAAEFIAPTTTPSGPPVAPPNATESGSIALEPAGQSGGALPQAKVQASADAAPTGDRYSRDLPDYLKTPLTPGTAGPAKSSSVFRSAMKSAKQQLDRGQLAEALLTLSIWYEDPQLSKSDHSQLVSLLDQVAGTVIYSQKHLLARPYQVRGNETLDTVAKNYQVPTGLLAKINAIRYPGPLKVGQQLKVVRGPFNAAINRESGTLTLFLGERYAGRFPVKMGPEFEQISGTFFVKSKSRAHASNQGMPWIELTRDPSSATTGPERVGLAGMADPSAASSGTVPGRVGVSVKDGDDLIDILSQGSKITIIR